MPGEQSVEIIGLPRLERTLRTFALKITRMDRAARAAAQLLASSGRAGAPVRSGRLASSVHASEARDGGASVGSDLIYAPVIHWGWAGHNISANPFLSRAIDQNTDRVLDLYARDADAALGKVRGA